MMLAITGHTSGLGKGLFDYFSKDNTVKGFSRSNGYDITRFYDVIVNKSLECDIFINNACVHDFQSKIFNLLLENWKNDNLKTIVNINSIAKFRKHSDSYSVEKFKLSEKSIESSLDDDNIKCRIINCNIGPIKYGRFQNIKNILTIDECVSIISYAINLPQHIELAELSFWTLDRSIHWDDVINTTS